MSIREFYIKMDQVKEVESRMQSQKQGGKYSSSDTYLPPIPWYTPDEESTSPVSTPTTLKRVTPPSTLADPNVFSDEEETSNTYPFLTNEMDENVDLNSLLSRDESPSEFASPSSLYVKEEPWDDPLSFAPVSLPTEEENLNLFSLPMDESEQKLNVQHSKDETSKAESNAFKNMRDKFEPKIGKSTKQKTKKTPYDTLKEKPIIKNVMTEDITQISKISPNEQTQLKQSTSKKDVGDAKHETRDTKTVPIIVSEDMTKGKQIDSRMDAKHETQNIKTVPSIVSDDMTKSKQIDSPMDWNTDNQKKRSREDGNKDAANRVHTTSTSKKAHIQANAEPPKDGRHREKEQLIKMNHFYYTKKDCYMRYRDMLGLDRRRRKYVDKFKNHPMAVVELKRVAGSTTRVPSALKNGYKELLSIQPLVELMVSCMMIPCDRNECDPKFGRAAPGTGDGTGMGAGGSSLTGMGAGGSSLTGDQNKSS